MVVRGVPPRGGRGTGAWGRAFRIRAARQLCVDATVSASCLFTFLYREQKNYISTANGPCCSWRTLRMALAAVAATSRHWSSGSLLNTSASRVPDPDRERTRRLGANLPVWRGRRARRPYRCTTRAPRPDRAGGRTTVRLVEHPRPPRSPAAAAGAGRPCWHGTGGRGSRTRGPGADRARWVQGLGRTKRASLARYVLPHGQDGRGSPPPKSHRAGSLH